MKVIRYFGVAATSIAANKLRSSLTMLGIIIGVAAVLITLGIGAGAAASITADIQSQGTNLLEASPRGGANTLTMADVRVLSDPLVHPEFSVVLPVYTGNQTLVAGDNSSSNRVQGVTADYAAVRNLTVANGEFFSEQAATDQESVVVLGSQVASDLFPGVDPVGEEVRVGGALFTVVGVLEESGGNNFNSNDNMAFTPLSVAQGRLFNAERYRGELTVTSITIQVDPTADMDAAQKNAETTLRMLHGLRSDDDNDFQIFNQASLLELASTVTATLSALLGGIGAVSLLVGGIGIMNIMLVSVTERTREIGVRRALGAHDRDILLQFLVEALVLCLLGGMIGIGLSYGVGFLVSKIPNMPVAIVIRGWTVFLALGVCSAAAFVFGLYPAIRATRLDPIEALRYE
jgi:putative ABC transport system permease protein